MVAVVQDKVAVQGWRANTAPQDRPDPGRIASHNKAVVVAAAVPVVAGVVAVLR